MSSYQNSLLFICFIDIIKVCHSFMESEQKTSYKNVQIVLQMWLLKVMVTKILIFFLFTVFLYFRYCLCCNDRIKQDRIDIRSRSSHQRCSMKKGVLRNSTKFTGKHLRQSLFFNKVAGLRPAALLKKRL